MLLCELACMLMVCAVAHGQSPFDAAPIHYSSAKLDDPVTHLVERVRSGDVALKFDARHGYLKSLLQALRISETSQVLVFSKTSFQRVRITPQKPRALYFSDSVYLGWVQQGDVIEISAVDPQLGAIFYTLNQKNEQAAEFTRQDRSCMLCHSSSAGERIPGHVLQSVSPDANGRPIIGSSRYHVDHGTPIERRWGGWYVTGTHGLQRHRGNLVMRNRQTTEPLDLEAGANRRTLAELFDVAPYLSPHSDIVALLVLEHQVAGHNLLTAANYEIRRALYHNQTAQSANTREATASADNGPDLQSRIQRVTETVLRYLLFADEAPLAGPFVGTSGFTEEFAKRGIRDESGRSLREFDLRTRLFRYPCSYLIYSASFDGLPQPLLQQIYRRLVEVLNNQHPDDERNRPYAGLSAADRKDILQILSETKPTLRHYLQETPQAPSRR